jgi:hypothetical protein
MPARDSAITSTSAAEARINDIGLLKGFMVSLLLLFSDT